LYFSKGLNYHIYLNVCIYKLICALFCSFEISISKKREEEEEKEGSTKYTQTNVDDGLFGYDC